MGDCNIYYSLPINQLYHRLQRIKIKALQNINLNINLKIIFN